MVSVLWTLFCLDLFLVAFAIEVLILEQQRMGIMIMFASEFTILTATLWSTIAKYVLNCIDLRSGAHIGWNPAPRDRSRAR